MNRLLVTGVESVVGGNVAAALAGRCEVVGLSWPPSDGPARCGAAGLDGNDAAEIVAYVEQLAPRWIVHCGGLAQSSWDLSTATVDPVAEECRAGALAEAARRTHARLAVISTDAIFAGPRLFHCENSAPSSPGHVADAAREVERLLAGGEALIVRSHAYGWSPSSGAVSYAESLWRAFNRGEICEADAQRHATPILATDLAELVFKALELGLQGVCHITGAERTSSLRFASELAIAGGFASHQVRLERTRSTLRRAVADETSLNTRRARRELERPLPLLREGLARFAEQARSGYRARLAAQHAQLELQAA
jgi:dTDP-4-dehydrorhamnose reductase